MNILCSICLGSFTGLQPESIYSSYCGHIFHRHCILIQIGRSKNCPECRRILTERDIFKLNLFTGKLPAEPASGPGNKNWELAYQDLKETCRSLAKQNTEIRSMPRYGNNVLACKKDFSNSVFNYYVSSEMNNNTKDLELGNLRIENSHFRLQVDNLRNESKSMAKNYDYLLQKYVNLKKTRQDDLNLKERRFVDYKNASERNMESLKSEIRNLRQTNSEHQNKCNELESELKDLKEKHKDLQQKHSHLEKARENELYQKLGKFVSDKISSENRIRNLEEENYILRQKLQFFDAEDSTIMFSCSLPNGSVIKDAGD